MRVVFHVIIFTALAVSNANAAVDANVSTGSIAVAPTGSIVN